MSKQAVNDLLTRLSNDSQEAQQFKADPDSAMAGLDLTEQEKELLRSGSRQAIQEYVGPTVYGILGVGD